MRICRAAVAISSSSSRAVIMTGLRPVAVCRTDSHFTSRRRGQAVVCINEGGSRPICETGPQALHTLATHGWAGRREAATTFSMSSRGSTAGILWLHWVASLAGRAAAGRAAHPAGSGAVSAPITVSLEAIHRVLFTGITSSIFCTVLCLRTRRLLGTGRIRPTCPRKMSNRCVTGLCACRRLRRRCGLI